MLSDLEQMKEVLREHLTGEQRAAASDQSSVSQESQGQHYPHCGLGAPALSGNVLEIQIPKIY